MNIPGAEFIALAEGGKWPGEAILWSVDGTVAAIDLGAGAVTGEHVAAQHPQILLLTHDDDDHIGGWSGFAAEADRQQHWPEQIWLPYEWAALAIAAATPARMVATTRRQRVTSETVIEELGLDNWTMVATQGDDDGGNVRSESVLDTIDWNTAYERVTALNESKELEEQVEALLAPRTKKFEGIGTREAVAKRAVDSVRKILQIVQEAHQSPTTVKLFSIEHAMRNPEPQPWRSEGSAGLITIPNGREVEPKSLTTPATVQHLAMLYTLTIQNRRALTSLLWTCWCVGSNKAMVWSDSSGEWTAESRLHLPIERVALATAPHHGSANADHTDAWTAMWGATAELILVAAGGQAGQQVNGAFLAAPHERRACNRCRHQPKERKAQRVTANVPHHDAATLASAHCVRPQRKN